MRIEDISLCKVRLRHQSRPLPDIPARVHAACAPLREKVAPSMRVAVAVGSRGIANIDGIVHALVDTLRDMGAAPFIIPAMGSHGGATAEGQARVLAEYGITEATMGVPVRSSLDVVSLGTTGGTPDIPVWLDKYASEADGIVVVNRVKAHTDFHGTHESGVVKMLTIGLGKHAQALAVHRYGVPGLRDGIPRVSGAVLERANILGALAILEDGYDQTSDIDFATGKDIFALDRGFLDRSREMMAKLPFDALDVLIVDRMGKNYSGTGMDTNVIGRLCIRGQMDASPACARIAVLDLSEESHGNALGVGLADVTTARLRDKIDWQATNANVITSGFLERGFLPLVAENDRNAVAVAVSSSGAHTADAIRVARIRDTLHLDEAYVSTALLKELEAAGTLEAISEPAPLRFASDGTIAPF